MANFTNTRSIGNFQQMLGASGIEVVPNKNLNEDGTQGYHVRFMKGNERVAICLIAKALGKTLSADLQVSDYETVDKKTGELIRSKMIHKAGVMAEAVATYDFSAVSADMNQVK